MDDESVQIEVSYDDQPEDIVDSFTAALAKMGITVECVDDESVEGTNVYELRRAEGGE